MRARDALTLPEGRVVLQYPIKLSKESFAEIIEWLNRASTRIMRISEFSPDLEKRTHFERIVEFFQQFQNEPKPIMEISACTGIERSAVAAVIYRTHSDKFTRVGKIQGIRGCTWRLSEKFECERGIL
jgi:hypothetical protein